MTRRFLLAAAAACVAALVVPPVAAQQGYPSKPVRLILPFAAGGPVDLVARVVGPRVADRIGQPIIVDNRVGAGGNIAGDFVLKAPPDGHTLLFVTTGLITNPFFLKGSPEPSQFSGVVQLLTTPFVLVASNSFPPKSMAEIVSYIQANPGKVSCASSGALPTVGCELLRTYAKTDMIMVSYKGNGPAMQAVMSGEANLLFDPSNTAHAQSTAGRVRAIATPSPKRGIVGFPDLPSISETLPDFYFEGLQGIAVHPSTPREIIQRLNREFTAAMQIPAVRDPLIKVGLIPALSTPEAFDQKMRSDFARFGRVAKDARIQPQ